MKFSWRNSNGSLLDHPHRIMYARRINGSHFRCRYPHLQKLTVDVEFEGFEKQRQDMTHRRQFSDSSDFRIAQRSSPVMMALQIGPRYNMQVWL